MKPVHVVFAAPFFLDTTIRFIRSAAELPGVRLSLVSQDPVERLPADVRHRLAQFYRVQDGLDPQQLADATRYFGSRLGAPHRLIGALEQLQVPLGEVRDALGIDGMSAAVARNFRDKARMKTVLSAAGIPCARHRLCSSLVEAVAFAREVGYPLVVKPPAGAGSVATYQVGHQADLEGAVNSHNPSPDRPVLVEEFMMGDEHSFEVVSIHGKPVWYSLTQYQPAPLDVMRNPWIQWCVLLPRETDHPQWDAVKKVGFATNAALGMGTGLTHMEWFRRKDGSAVVSEIGARPPGAQIVSLNSYANDFDLYRAWAKLVIHDEFDPPTQKYAAGAAFFRGQGNGQVVRVEGVDEAQREIGHLVVEARLPRPGQRRSSSYEGEGYAIVRHPDTAVVQDALHRMIKRIRVVTA